jgi:hypothetical protein
VDKLKNFNKIFLVLIIGVFALSSCKSTKKALKKPIKERGFDYLYSKMKENQVNVDYFNAKLNIIYYQDKKSKTELKGQLRMKTDSIIWLTVSPALGIEALRMVLTPDSIKMVNRLNKTYLLGDYKLIKDLLNTTIDFSIIEDLLLGNDLSQYSVKKIKVKVDKDMYNISILKRRKLKKYIRNQNNMSLILINDFWIDPYTYRIKKMKLTEFGDLSKSLVVYYDDYSVIDGQMVPLSITIDVYAENRLTIKIKYKKVVIDKPLRFPFKISKKYKKMELKN